MKNSNDLCSHKLLVSVESNNILQMGTMRPKLLFDTLYTLEDIQYAVFYAAITFNRTYELHEYFIHHMDGCNIDTDGEKQQVIKCLDDEIERKVLEKDGHNPHSTLCKYCLSLLPYVFQARFPS